MIDILHLNDPLFWFVAYVAVFAQARVANVELKASKADIKIHLAATAFCVVMALVSLIVVIWT